MDTGRTAIAARIYISLRREAKRSIDVEWLLKNTEYAREIISLAKQHSPELVELATHYEAQLPGQHGEVAGSGHQKASQHSSPSPQAAITDRYIGRLR